MYLQWVFKREQNTLQKREFTVTVKRTNKEISEPFRGDI